MTTTGIAPAIAWQSARFPVGSRFDLFAEALCRVHYRWNMRPRSGTGFYGDVGYCTINEMLFTDVNVAPMEGDRDPPLIASDGQENFAVFLIEDGTELLEQGGRAAVLGPQSLSVWNTSRPARFESRERVRQLSVVIPARPLRAIVPNIDNYCAKVIDGRVGTGLLLASHIRALGTVLQQSGPNTFDATTATLQLTAAALRGPTHETCSQHAMRAALRDSIESFIIRNLADPELTPERIAQVMRISLRYLHRLYEGEPFTISEWIRRQRLRYCDQALRSSAHRHRSITDLCHQWGFSDAAHFSRVYRREFGVSPSEARRAGPGEIASL
jgi:AraC-like DNA-binding protein